jgi:3-deoxy-D-manno-octulosonate 8-phosphate phosphatase (KDO 8-P phosphatase)
VLEKKIEAIKLMVVNCDGVLTDGHFFFTKNGEEGISFSSKDVFGFKLLAERSGFNIVLINSERATPFLRFALKTGLDDRFLGIDKKDNLIDQLKANYDLEAAQIAYIGCELDDLPLMRMVGFSICPLDAAYEVRNAANYVCNSCSGSGVIREIADLFNVKSPSVSYS